MAYSILIVDDNDADVALLLRGFADIQVPVCPTHVRDGESVLAQLSSGRHFDLAVLDYYLPRKNAEEIIRAWRPRGRLPRIVVLSSSLSRDQERQLRTAGVEEIFEKPSSLMQYAPLAANLVKVISERIPGPSSAAAPDSPGEINRACRDPG